jgi:hypothetical protein
MTRKEEIEQAAEEYYNEVKYLSDLSAFPIAAFKAGAEWADKTMIDKAIKFFQSKSKHGMIEENINEFINEFCKEMWK